MYSYFRSATPNNDNQLIFEAPHLIMLIKYTHRLFCILILIVLKLKNLPLPGM